MSREASLLTEIDRLKQFCDWINEHAIMISDEKWFSPIKAEKWSIHQIIGHLFFWDQYTLEELAPKMTSGLELFFIDVQVLNDQSKLFSDEIKTKEEMLKRFVEKRATLIEYFKEHADGKLIFTLHDHPYSQAKYLHIFTEHDQEHRIQIEEYLNLNDI
jgi:hypothetical protein